MSSHQTLPSTDSGSPGDLSPVKKLVIPRRKASISHAATGVRSRVQAMVARLEKPSTASSITTIATTPEARQPVAPPSLGSVSLVSAQSSPAQRSLPEPASISSTRSSTSSVKGTLKRLSSKRSSHKRKDSGLSLTSTKSSVYSSGSHGEKLKDQSFELVPREKHDLQIDEEEADVREKDEVHLKEDDQSKQEHEKRSLTGRQPEDIDEQNSDRDTSQDDRTSEDTGLPADTSTKEYRDTDDSECAINKEALFELELWTELPPSTSFSCNDVNDPSLAIGKGLVVGELNLAEEEEERNTPQKWCLSEEVNNAGSIPCPPTRPPPLPPVPASLSPSKSEYSPITPSSARFPDTPKPGTNRFQRYIIDFGNHDEESIEVLRYKQFFHQPLARCLDDANELHTPRTHEPMPSQGLPVDGSSDIRRHPDEVATF